MLCVYKVSNIILQFDGIWFVKGLKNILQVLKSCVIELCSEK